MESVCSLAYHVPKTIASVTLKTDVLVTSDMPRWSVRLSVISVPTTEMSTTLSQ